MAGQSHILRRTVLVAALALGWGLPNAAPAEATLVMAEEKGCLWCARWNAEIAPIYPKTAEGKAAPLRRVDIHDTAPDDLTFTTALRFTPTFVLMQDGQEVARLEGYPGEDFFWGHLQRMLTDAQISFETSG